MATSSRTVAAVGAMSLGLRAVPSPIRAVPAVAGGYRLDGDVRRPADGDGRCRRPRLRRTGGPAGDRPRPEGGRRTGRPRSSRRRSPAAPCPRAAAWRFPSRSTTRCQAASARPSSTSPSSSPARTGTTTRRLAVSRSSEPRRRLSRRSRRGPRRGAVSLGLECRDIRQPRLLRPFHEGRDREAS